MENHPNLSSLEKRKLLLKILKEKDKASQSFWLRKHEWMRAPDQFTMNVADLNTRVMLDPSIRISTSNGWALSEPANIFLTGATGFLGSFLLHELLVQTQADVLCLVRCSNIEEGRSRILQTLGHYFPENNLERSRIKPIPGDLSKPMLGLSALQFEGLAHQSDAIYHCGASVNWLTPYSQLKPSNVSGTQEVLRLACQDKVKPVHYISSISVFPLIADVEAKVIYEQDNLDHEGVLYGGYTQSKWVSEKIVAIAQSRGLPVAIYRPGMIIGHSQTGVWNTTDITSKMLKSWIELGYAPDLDAGTDMTPVDYVSKAIVHLSRQPRTMGNAFHLVNPRLVHSRDMVTWVREFGYPLELIPYERWREKLIQLASISRANASYSLAPLFSEKFIENEQESGSWQNETLDKLGIIMVSQYASKSIKFDCQDTLAGLDGSSIVCPQIDANLFNTYLTYFVHSGFLDAPRSAI